MEPVEAQDETVAQFAATLQDGTRVTFAHGWSGAEGVVAALAEARANLGRTVELVAATHPKAQGGGRVLARLRFGVLSADDAELPGRVREAGEGGSLRSAGSHTLAYPGVDDATVAVRLALYLVGQAYGETTPRESPCLFRPLPPAQACTPTTHG